MDGARKTAQDRPDAHGHSRVGSPHHLDTTVMTSIGLHRIHSIAGNTHPFVTVGHQANAAPVGDA